MVSEMREWAEQVCRERNPKVPAHARDDYWRSKASEGISRAPTIGRRD